MTSLFNVEFRLIYLNEILFLDNLAETLSICILKKGKIENFGDVLQHLSRFRSLQMGKFVLKRIASIVGKGKMLVMSIFLFPSCFQKPYFYWLFKLGIV